MHNPKQEKQETLERVVELVRKRFRGEQAAQIAAFLAHYYAKTPPEDLRLWRDQDLYGAAIAQWNQLQRRASGSHLINVYNPDFEEHGWESTHTIVELVLEDMPFLVDSVSMELARHGLTIHLIIHPVISVRRDRAGHLLAVVGSDDENAVRESIMHFEIDRQTDRAVLKTVRKELGRVLMEVRAAVEDQHTMRAKMAEIVEELESNPPPLDADAVEEDKAFLRWAIDEHFTYLGYRAYDLIRGKGEDALKGVGSSGIGILRASQSGASRSFAVLPPELQKLAREPILLILTKSNSRSLVHRSANMDYIGIKRFDAKGKVIGEHRFLGLYTSSAYSQSPRRIPVLRHKVETVLKKSGSPPDSHDGKTLMHILEGYPRDELIQTPEDELFETCMGILNLQERQRVRLFVRRDPFGRFVSCLVYVPRDSYNTELRVRMGEILKRALGGTDIEFTVQISDLMLARVHFIVRTAPGQIPEFDVAELEADLVEATRSWQDMLFRTLIEHYGEEKGNRLHQKYRMAFPAGYREYFTSRTAVYDIEHIERLDDEKSLEMLLYRPLEAPSGALRFKLYRRGEPIFLSKTLPMLENMGVEVVFEHPYQVQPEGEGAVWIHNFGLQHAAELEFAAEEIKGIFQDAFARVWLGDVENDAFNRLVLSAQLDWRESTLLRAYTRYLRQVSANFSESYIAATLEANAGIARRLVQLFHVRFDPHKRKGAEERANKLIEQINTAIDSVSSLDEDRILRRVLAAMQATLRTNYYQHLRKGVPKSYISFKFSPKEIPDMPAPKPAYEIFVYSPRTEGVHLRGGKVARGGLRWSDRREDFRTEVLGLLKSQLVKNAVIVPVGAKGGFVVKQPPVEGGREALQEEVKFCYRSFIRGLLDVTDNLVGGKVVAPQDVVRHDDDDPYLVVAADKGTATFSDLANEVAGEYGFWLGDAFASGGSAGYDHKKLGITARGAWESVKLQFAEMGLDMVNQTFTVVGIGDMAGDVFGNGLLYSRNTKLVAAFNHLHIFIDPDPDPETSFKERERLFQLPHSTWEDYDRTVLSPGGGIFSRRDKSILLSPEVQRLINVSEARLAPNELIRAILRMSSDLLWSGGIGTFVKASHESHADVGDRANDAIRVDGRELGCAAVGEGGNLGLTQLGRIEYAARGGRVNTDFVDNSGGVDCSDHEVNIKILLDNVVANGDMTLKQRNQLMARMADEVSDHVLEHNRHRAQAISMIEVQAFQLLDEQSRFMHALEREGLLDRALEFLPNDEVLAERQTEGRGLLRPEISVLLAYSAIVLYQQLLASDIADDPFFVHELRDYFPQPLRERFAEEMMSHRLHREIITTQVTNSMVNRVGITFIHRLREETGAEPGDIARSYTAAREVFAVRNLWNQIEAQQSGVAAPLVIQMFLECGQLVEQATRWFLRRLRQPLAIDETVARFSAGAQALAQVLPGVVVDVDREELEQAALEYTTGGADESLARQLASLRMLYAALDVVEVSETSGYSIQDVAYVYFHLGDRLGLHWLRDQIASLSTANHWQAMACSALHDDVTTKQGALVASILRQAKRSKKIDLLIENWLVDNEAATRRWQRILADLHTAGSPDLAMLSVAVREVRDLAQASAQVTTK